ncbi:hypothetical protein HMPREF0682_1699 [Propionibacterium acidifaciens F0233]|uniref:Uncharacterized protein n=1 Tax=Propionibacterium acidifaciens F0233 TaxID=553198 RepID=U2QFM0_9ACTN|nr:hypothetical protein HMPREF0682_1699 [Propionibacterium acidifaciens F0233]
MRWCHVGTPLPLLCRWRADAHEPSGWASLDGPPRGCCALVGHVLRDAPRWAVRGAPARRVDELKSNGGF